MAEIDVERTGRREVWPWVIGAIALVVLIAALASLLGSNDPAVDVRQATPESTVPAGS